MRRRGLDYYVYPEVRCRIEGFLCGLLFAVLVLCWGLDVWIDSL